MSEANTSAAVTEDRWPKRWHCVEARDNEYAEQSGPGKPIFAVRNGVNIGTVDLCPLCFETFDHHAAKPEQPPFAPQQFVRIKASGAIVNVARCEKRVVHGKLRWVVDDCNGSRAFADHCELFEGDKSEVRYACSKRAAVGDRVKEVGADFGQYLRVSKIHDDGSIGVETLDGKSCAIAIASSLEFVPEASLNQPRDYPLDPVCELELEQTRQQLDVAMALLGQCDNRMFLVSDFEIRKAAGGWKLCHPLHGALVGNDLKATVFADPVQAAQRATDLSTLSKGA